MAVMIGVDPHKRSHTAVAVDADEVELDRVEVCTSATQVEALLAWADAFRCAHVGGRVGGWAGLSVGAATRRG